MRGGVEGIAGEADEEELNMREKFSGIGGTGGGGGSDSFTVVEGEEEGDPSGMLDSDEYPLSD